MKELLVKKHELLTDEEKAKVKEHLEEYVAKVRTLSEEYGVEFYAALSATSAGIFPTMEVRVIPAAAPVEAPVEGVQEA